MTIGKMNIINFVGLTIEFEGCKLISKINFKDLIVVLQISSIIFFSNTTHIFM